MGRIRQLLGMVFSKTSSWVSLGRYSFNYSRDAGDLMESSTVAATVRWFAKNFPEAPPAMWRQLDNGQEERERKHDLLRLLQRPNEHYSGPILWMATTTDWNVNGDAYWIVIPSRTGRPVELWWAPSWQIEPKGDDTDSNVFVSHYEYRVDGATYNLDPKYVIHFRQGLDPKNPRRGCSPLKSVLREVVTDNEAADFTASLLRNMAVPGLLISPDIDQPLDPAEAEAAKAYMESQFTGDNRGRALVMSGRTKVQEFGFSPEQLLLRELRQIPEERITAVLGVPAVVVGLGAGLARSTFTNMAEAREAAYESGLIPAQRILGEDIRFQLLPLFGDDPFEWRFGFDLSTVRVLQEDLYRQAQRHDLLIRGGWEMVGEGRRAMGLEVDDERDSIFLRPLNIAEVDGHTGAVRSLAPSSSGRVNGQANGNGKPVLSAESIADEVERRIERRELLATN